MMARMVWAQRPHRVLQPRHTGRPVRKVFPSPLQVICHRRRTAALAWRVPFDSFGDGIAAATFRPSYGEVFGLHPWMSPAIPRCDRPRRSFLIWLRRAARSFRWLQARFRGPLLASSSRIARGYLDTNQASRCRLLDCRIINSTTSPIRAAAFASSPNRSLVRRG